MVIKGLGRGDYFFKTIVLALILRYIPVIATWAIPLVIEIIPDSTIEELLVLGVDLTTVLDAMFLGKMWYIIAIVISVFTVFKWTSYRLRDAGVHVAFTVFYIPLYFLYYTGSFIEQIAIHPVAAILGIIMVGGPLLILLLLPQDHFRAKTL